MAIHTHREIYEKHTVPEKPHSEKNEKIENKKMKIIFMEEVWY
jgi:hypothetical protein